VATKKKTAPTSDALVERFLRLFEGNRRSSGRYDPARDRPYTEEGPITPAVVVEHIAGTRGCGVVPIDDADSCLWGAIDIDNHDSDEDIDIADIDRIILQNKLPLIPCRSKSGGCHVYIFLDRPQPAARIRALLTKWAGALGHGGSEIFPKQNKLTLSKDGSGKKMLGNWINLPYMGGDGTNRYAIRDSKRLGFAEFLDLAEKLRQSDSDLRGASLSDHPEAPPCVQKMYAHGVAQGQRNEAMYNIVVYLRKADPTNVESRAAEANSSVFSKPLARSEMARTVNSAQRDTMGYRCNEEPCRSLCDRDTCLTRKFGITSADAERLETTDALPMFTDLCKYVTEPVRWEIKIDGRRVGNISTDDLLDWRAMRKMTAEKLTKVVPMIKNQEWERILAPLMKDARVIDAPDDASVAGVVRERLREYASKTDMMNPGEDTNDRKALLRGMPVVQKIRGERFVLFRAQDFVSYLKRTKSEELKGVNLWFAIKDLGVETMRIRVPGAAKGENNINVWGLPAKEALVEDVDAPKYESEL
jgi:hypothetical protein